MIVPMKKVSLVIMGEKKEEALRILRKTGLVHIEISEGCGEKLSDLQQQVSLIESALFLIGKKGKTPQKELDCPQSLEIAHKILSLDEEKKECVSQRIQLSSELERLKDWGEINPQSISELKSKGIDVTFYDMPRSEFESLPQDVKTVVLKKSKHSVKLLLVGSVESDLSHISTYRLNVPQQSTEQMKTHINELFVRVEEINSKIAECSSYADSLKKALGIVQKDIEFEVFATGMAQSDVSSENEKSVSVAYFRGYIEAENLDVLKKTASSNSWGLLVDDPNEEDDVPTKLRNNKFVSLIYPLTDFLGTVPGYFEYDISGWFLMFILIFFGIIFGDGGYGLLISVVAAIPIVSSIVKRKKIQPAFLLVGLFGLSTILWGTLTCTWFGLPAQQLPQWIKGLSVPLISNVYADKIWYPFWTGGTAGLTTAQNLQIFCFSLALVQLTVAHIKGVIRNKKSLKLLGDVGAILQLFGIFYLVLSLVVNPEVFSFGLIISGIPVGTVAIALIGIGFAMSFAFSNFAGSIIKSILASCTNIVSVLLGVVNVFSDIVSYIRLWAVGLAGAAISATVNELAGPFFGNFMFMIIAIVLLVFGHGLNMILNVLSVIVHGIRLNTLEFSSHLDMSWSGHKFKPFKE